MYYIHNIFFITNEFCYILGDIKYSLYTNNFNMIQQEHFLNVPLLSLEDFENAKLVTDHKTRGKIYSRIITLN